MYTGTAEAFLLDWKQISVVGSHMYIRMYMKTVMLLIKKFFIYRYLFIFYILNNSLKEREREREREKKKKKKK